MKSKLQILLLIVGLYQAHNCFAPAATVQEANFVNKLNKDLKNPGSLHDYEIALRTAHDFINKSKLPNKQKFFPSIRTSLSNYSASIIKAAKTIKDPKQRDKKASEFLNNHEKRIQSLLDQLAPKASAAAGSKEEAAPKPVKRGTGTHGAPAQKPTAAAAA